MAEYRLQFTADTQGASRSIKSLKQAIREAAREFEAAEIGSREFRQSAARVSSLKKNLNEVKASVSSLSGEYRNLGRSAQKAADQQEGAFRKVISAAGKLALAFATIQTAQGAFQAGIQREESERRISALSKAYGETAEAQQAASKAAERFGLSQTEANQAFAQIYARLRPIGIELGDIESAFNGFNTAAKLSGASIQEASSAWLQLSQALGSGVLRGEELNSVFEQTPRVVQAIAQEMGAPIGQIRDLASDGLITSDIVIRALRRIATDGAGDLEQAMQGPAQQVKNLQNEFENLQVAATTDLVPAIIDVIKELKGLLESLGPILRGLGAIAANTIGTISDLVNAATRPRAFAARKAIQGGRLPLAGFGGISGAEELFKGTIGTEGVGLEGLKREAANLARIRRQPVTDVLLELMQNRLAQMDAPDMSVVPSLPSSGGVIPLPVKAKGGARGKSAAERAAEEEARLQSRIRKLRIETQSTLQTALLRGRIAEAEMLGNEELVAKLQGEQRNHQVLVQLQKALEGITDEREQQALQIKAQADLEEAGMQTAIALEQIRLDQIKKQNEALFKRAGLRPEDRMAGGAGAFILGAPDLRVSPAEQQIIKYGEELRKLTDPIEIAVSGANAIGDAFGKAFQDVTTGVQSIREALAGVFRSIAQAFASMAAEIIAKQLAMVAFQQLIGVFGGGQSFGFSGVGPASLPGGPGFAQGFAMPSLIGSANGNVLRGGFQAFANGGVVNGPTLGLIGEGRFNEAVVPLPDGRKIPVDLGGAAGSNISTNIVVNMNNGQASSQMTGNGGQALGRELEGAVRNVILKESRPGGLIYSNR